MCQYLCIPDGKYMEKPFFRQEQVSGHYGKESSTSRVSGFPTLQCLSSGNSRLLLGPLIRDTSATHLVIFSQQHILQMDILESAVDTGDPHHILCALPTGFGKTMPMLLLGHLLPPGAGCKISDPFALHNVLSRVHYDDRGPPHPNWTAAAGRLQEVGLVSIHMDLGRTKTGLFRDRCHKTLTAHYYEKNSACS